MLDSLAEPLAALPNYLGGHMRLSLAALAAGLAISLPLGIFAAREPRLGGPALAIASTLQTIPSLALLALMVPLLGGTIGFAPAFLALTLYAVLPTLRNTIVGLQGVDPVVVEAAAGSGMTRSQSLWWIELPLAAPTILAGVRTSAVWIVGTATLATPVGATSLGNYIFSGLQTRNWTTVIFGCVMAAGLAIILDQHIRGIEYAARVRKRTPALFAGGGLALLIAASLGSSLWMASGQGGAQRLADSTGETRIAGQTIVIGAKGFTEQYILAELFEIVLEDEGAVVERRDNLGSTIAFDALVSGEIDIYVDYTGTLWATILERDDPVARHIMALETAAELYSRHGIVTLGRLGFENAYGIAMTRTQSEDWNIQSIDDLAARDFSIAGDPEFFARPEWVRTRDLYGLQQAETRGMDSTFMYGAVRDGEVDVIGAYTTDGRIAAYDLVILNDPRQALPPYDAVILLSPQAARSTALAAALTPLINAISAADMREANRRVDLDRETPAQAAEWLRGEVEN